MKKTVPLLLINLLILKALSQKIIDRPIVYDSVTKVLSLQCLKERHGLIQTEPTVSPKMIVSH
jgi:N-acetylmuramoyl-L-alanine amidase